MKIADYIKKNLSEWPNWLTIPLNYCNILGPLPYGLGYMRHIKEFEKTSPEDKLLAITNYAIKNVEYYRKRYRGLTIKSIADFEKFIIPIDKKEVMEHWEEFVADGVDLDKCMIGTTGGTSGKPMKIVLPENRYVHSLSFAHKQIKQFGWNYQTFAVIRNHHLPCNRKYMVNPILRQFIFDAFRMSPEYAHFIWTVMRRYYIHYLYAYPSAAYQFLKLCHQQKLDVAFIKLCWLTSEGVTKEQYHFIEKELNIPISYSYGHSELLIIAGNCPKSTLYHIEEQFGYCELLDKEGHVIRGNNVIGELVGTTFINRCFPLLRYRTGDFSSYADNICPTHGKSHRLLNTIEGHYDRNLIYKSDGTTTSTTALNLHGKIYEHIDGLQYKQEEKGSLIVMLIPNKDYTEKDTLFLLDFYKNAMGKDSKVEIRFVNALTFQSNGKFSPLISTVKQV